MSDISPTVIQGFIIPDPRLTVSSFAPSLSSLLSQGPIPGVPTANNETEMVLEAYGEQATDTTMIVQARTGGHPRPGDGATFAWRYTTDATTEYRGWEVPCTISGLDIINYSTTANDWLGPHVIRRADDGLVCVVMKGQQYVAAQYKAATATSWTYVQIADHGSVYANVASPTVLQLPGGRLLCFFWIEITASENQVQMYYSDDDGVSWTIGQKNCLVTPLDTSVYTPVKLRCAYLNGEILLVAGVRDNSGVTDRDRLIQYASDDLGATLVQVSITEGYSAVGDNRSRQYPEITVVNGRALVTYLKQWSSGTATIVPHRKYIGQAFDDLSAAAEDVAVQTTNPMEWGNKTAQTFVSGYLATWLDEDGVLWMSGCDFDTGELREVYCQRSTNDGLDWAMIGSGSAGGFGAAWWRGRDLQTFPQDITACSHQGRAVVVHTFAANPATHDPSLFAVYLGGYSTVVMPNLEGQATNATNRAAWEYTWLPYELPDLINGSGVFWTLATGGAPTIALGNAGLSITNAAAASVSYTTTTTPPGTLSEGLTVLIDGYCTTATASGGAFLDMTIGDATASYTIRVRWQGTGIVLRDMIAGSDLATDTSAAAQTAGGTGIQFLVDLRCTAASGNVGKCKVYWRLAVASGNYGSRKWNLLHSATTLQDGGVNNHEVGWGVITGATNDARFRILCYSSDSYTGEHIFNQDNPTDLLGRGFASSPLYVDAGLKVKAVDGPAFTRDSWNIATDYQYPPRNVFADVSPSPRTEWRSVNNATVEDFVIQFDSTLAQECELLGPTLGLQLRNINFRLAELFGYDVDTAAYVSLGTIEADTGQTAMNFLRRGDGLTVNVAVPGTRSAHWYTYQTLKDSYVRLANTADGGTTVVRKILHNSEGAWVGATTTKTARLILEGVTSTDPLGGTDCSMQIWSKDVVFIVNDATKYSRFRLRLPVQSTYEGYRKIGGITLGHVAWLGQRYSHGRILEHEPNNTVTTGRSGSRRVVNNGPMRRSAQVAWTDGIDVSQATQPAPGPHYIAAYTGGPAVAARADTPYLVAGLSEAIEGATVPVVYIPAYTRPALSTTAATLVNRNQFLYCRLVTGIRLENQLGDEWQAPSGEVFKVATATFEEEV